MKEYETLASLTSSRQANTGLMIYCRENLRYYIVQPDGYSPEVNDITFANSRIGKVVNIADAAFIKTKGGNVQDDLDSIIAGGLPSQSGNAGRVLSTDGTNAFWSSISERAVTPEDFGAAGDGVTDDTAAIQAAIDSVKGSSSIGLPTGYVYLAAKTYMHTGLVIDRAVAIVGADRNASRLKCLTTINPAITISLGFDVSNYQSAGRPGPTIAIKGVMIESDKSFASTNRGIEVQTPVSNAIRGWVYLEDTDIHAMGGDAIYGSNWQGAIKALNCKFINNGGKQINATSCADWQFIGCEFGVTPDDNILLSGCAAFTFTTCNIYSSTGDLVTIFTDSAATSPVNHHFVSCSFDRSSQGHGVVYNVRNNGNVTFANCYWTYNGQGAPETYSDIWIDSGVRRGPTVVGGWMQSAADSDSLYNIFFNGTLSSCYTTGVQFEAGNAHSDNVTNSLPQLKFEGAENFATFTDAQACTWAEVGDKLTVVERDSAPYIVKDSGYVALVGDITDAVGNVWELQTSRGELLASQVGILKGVDQSSLIQAFIDRLIDENLQGVLDEGEYISSTLYASGVANGLKLRGQGKSKTFIKRIDGGDGAGMRLSFSPYSEISDLCFVGDFTSNSNSTIGLAVLDCPNSTIERVKSYDTGSIGILAYHPNGPEDDLSYLVDNVKIINCEAELTPSGGIQMSGHRGSSIIDSTAKNTGTTGIYNKCPAEDCSIVNSVVFDCKQGFTLGTDYGTAQKGKRLNYSNLRAINCDTPFRFDNLEDSNGVNLDGVCTGLNDEGRGDGLRLQESKGNSFENVTIVNPASSRAAVRVANNSENNSVTLSNVPSLTAGAVNARFESGTSNNTVMCKNSTGDTTVRKSQDLGSGNVYAEKLAFDVVFNGSTSQNVTHGLRYDLIPFEMMTLSYSTPPQSPASLAIVSENTFSVEFASAYTGTVKVRLM